MLETIVIDLSEEWQKQAEKFSKRIQEAGKIPFCTQGKKEQTGKTPFCAKGKKEQTGKIPFCVQRRNEQTGNFSFSVRRWNGKQSEYDDFPAKDLDVRHAILITDDQAAAGYWKKMGGVCIGCTSEEGFFEGAELVTDSLEELDEVILEETLLHGLGLPVTIAKTERLMLREITEEDVEPLYQISQQSGMEYLMQDLSGDNCFEPERMRSYIKTVYRLCGYGLWSVWTREGELIGCCGLSDFVCRTSDFPTQMCRALNDGNGECSCRAGIRKPDLTSCIAACIHEEADLVDEGPLGYCECLVHGGPLVYSDDQLAEVITEDSWKNYENMCLELQYMLDNRYQGRGYGLEMCRAALEYAFTRTDREEVWVRIHSENRNSIRLARRLGFERRMSCKAVWVCEKAALADEVPLGDSECPLYCRSGDSRLQGIELFAVNKAKGKATLQIPISRK